MSTAKVVLPAASRATIEDLLQRAADDPVFFDLLVADVAEALAATRLGASERALVGSLDSVRLEESGVDIRPYRRFLSYPRMGGRVGGFIPDADEQ